MLKFLVRAEGRPERTIQVAATPALAGTDQGLPIVLSDPVASRRQFQIEVRPAGVVLKDLGSEAGTRVNGAFAAQVLLSVGDEIRVGGETIVLAALGVDVVPPSPVRSPSPAPGPAAPSACTASPVSPVSPVRPAKPAALRTRAARSGSLAPLVLVALVALGLAGAVFLLTEMKQDAKKRAGAGTLPVTARSEVPAGTSPAAAPPRTAPAPELPPPYVPPPDGPDGATEPPVPGPGPAAAAPASAPVPVPAPAPAPARAGPAAGTPAGVSEADRERKRREERADEGFRHFLETLPDRLSNYSFDGPIEDLRALLELAPEGALADRIAGRLDDLVRAGDAWAAMKSALTTEDGPTIALASGLRLRVTKVAEDGFTGTTGPAEVRYRWTQLRPEDVRSILVPYAASADDWLNLSAFSALLDLPTEEWEGDLQRAFANDPAVKPRIDAALARRRGVAVPEGGFVLYEGAWVTPEDRAYLEKGYVKYEGKWLSHDDYMAARGYVRHEGRWLTPEAYEKVLEAQREAEALAARYLPKGLIDEPGHGDAVPWEKKIEIETAHYKIQTDLSKDVARDLAYTMEVLITNFQSIFGLRKTGQKFTVNLVANHDEYLQHWPRQRGSLGFTSSRGEICTFYQPPMTTSVLMHEGTHQILYKFVDNCPRWLHEGMATYFECSRFRFNPGKKRVELEVGLLNSMRLMGIQAQIRAGRTVPLDVFMKGGGGDVYQQGWAFIYYLAKGKDGQYASRLFDFIQEANNPSNVVEKFQKDFRVKDLAKFEKEWKSYILSLDPADGIRVDSPHK